MSREILFYSDFPFGYHNPEAEERMRRFATRGYDVHYVEQLGIRNPRPRHLLRMLRRVRRSHEAFNPPFEVISPKLLAPRHKPVIRELNQRWLARQLLDRLRDPRGAIFWVRYPTPELVPLIERTLPALVIYECVDDHEGSPGMTDRLRRLLGAAERRILATAGLVLASSEPIRARLAVLHPKVLRFPAAAVDMAAFAAPSRDADTSPVALYAGHADFRFDADLMADVARHLPEWTFVVTGPASREVRRRLDRCSNVRLTGSRPAAEIPGLLAGARVCLLPYRTGSFSDSLFPVKLVEYLAAGRPVVGVPMSALEEFSDVVAVAGQPGDFAAAIVDAAARDSAETQSLRRERVRSFDWDRRIDEMEEAIQGALAHD